MGPVCSILSKGSYRTRQLMPASVFTILKVHKTSSTVTGSPSCQYALSRSVYSTQL